MIAIRDLSEVSDPEDHYRFTPEQILKSWLRRRDEASGRNERYMRLMSYYFGKQSHGSRALHEVLAATATGRPLIRDLGVSLEVNKRYVSNKIQPIVDDYQALLGRLPTIRIDAPEAGEPGVAKAEKQEKYIVSTYQMADMPYHQAFAGWCLTLLGDAVYVCEIDIDTDRVLPCSVLPMSCYPTFQRGPRRYDLWDLLVESQYTYEECQRDLGVTPRSDEPGDCTVITYMSPYQRTIIVGSDPERAKVGPSVKWNLGFCPAVWARNKINGDFVSSDVESILNLQDMYDFTLNIMADGLVEMTYPVRLIKGDVQNPDGPYPIGPGTNLEGGPNSDIKVVGLTPPPQAGMQFSSMVMDDMQTGSGTSEVRQQGMPDRSNISGRAIQSAQGPQATRIDLRQITLGTALTKLNARIMATQEKAPVISARKLELQGRYKGMSFKEDFQPKLDIDGWYVNTAIWDELIGTSRGQRIQMGVELVNAKLADRAYAMQLAGIEDPAQMVKRVHAEMEEEAKFQQEMQKDLPGAQAPGPQAVPARIIPATGMPAPPPPMAMRRPAPPPAAPAMPAQGPAGQPVQNPSALPSGVPMGVTVNAIKAQLVGVHLYGEVFAIGDLAQSGQAMRAQLRITDPRDFRKVRDAVLQADKDQKPDVRFAKEENLPSDKVKVA